MDDQIRNLMRHPRFGRAIETNPVFREFFKVNTIGTYAAGLLSKFKFTANGQLEDPLGNVYSRGADESYQDFLIRASQQVKTGFTGAKNYSNIENMYFSGGQTNLTIRELAKRKGYTAKVTTFNPKGMETKEARAALEGMIKYDDSGAMLGLLRPDADSMSYLEFFDRNNQAVNMNTIQEILGVRITGHPNAFKRYNMFLTDRQVERVAGNREAIQVLAIDPTKFFDNDPAAKRAAQLAVRTGDAKNLNDAYARMMDGFSVVTDYEIKRQIDFMTDQARELQTELDYSGLPKTSAKYIEKQRNIKMMLDEVNKLKKNEFQGGFNVRIFNAVDQNGKMFDYGKGDVQHMFEDRIFNFLRGSEDFRDMDDNALREKLKEISFIVSSADRKDEILATDSATGVVRMFHQPTAHDAYSNSLSMATHGEILDPEMPGGQRYLMQGLRASIETELNEIAEGKVPGGLYKMIEEIESEVISPDLSPLERAAKEQSKAYARRLKIFLRGGGDFRTNPYMAQQAMNTVKEHHFRMARNPDGTPSKIMFQGAEHNALTLRMPMRMSSATHIGPSQILQPGMRAGMTSYDDKSGRFAIHGAESIYAHHAAGGFDYDDMIVDGLRYDPKTRRALYFAKRDPDALGEYMFYEADIRTDPNLPKGIKDIAGERDMLLTKVRSSQNTQTLPRDLAKLDGINRRLHRYFSGERVMVNGKWLQQSDIPTIDLAKQYADDAHRMVFAPIGNRVTASTRRAYGRLDPLRSFATTRELGGQDEYLSRLVAQSSPTARSSLFRYVGHGRGGTDELADFMQAGFFQRHDKIEKAIELAGQTSVKEFSAEEVLKRMNAELDGRGMLGQFVNPFAVVEETLRKYVNIDNYGDVDLEKAARFQERFVEEFKNAGLHRVDREKIIDAMTKSAGADLFEAVPTMLQENAFKTGALIKRMQDIATEMDFDFNFGIDPVTYQMRGKTMTNKLLEGYGGDDIRKLLIPENDVTAYMSQTFGRATQLRDEVTGEMIPARSKEIAANLLKDIQDFKPTALETTRAQEFLSYYSQNMAEIKEATSNQEFMTNKLMQGLEADDIEGILAPYTHDAAQVQSLMKLQEWGLLDDTDALDRQLLAVARLAAEHMVDTGSGIDAMTAFDALMRGTTDEEIPNIAELYQDALVNHSGLQTGLLDDIQAADDRDFNKIFGQFFRWDKEANEGYGAYETVRHGLNPFLDRKKLYNKLSDRAHDLSNQAILARDASGSDKAKRRLQQRADRLWEMRSHALQQAAVTERYVPKTDIAPGLSRYLGRQLADETAEKVTSGHIISDTFNAMKRFDRRAITDLMQIPAFRKGAIGAGIFAGIGLLYGATKDRTFGDMQGPPLLPGGSAYEEYREVPPDMSSIYSTVRGSSFGPGVLYKINMNGSFDSGQMRDRIQSITGSPVDTRVFNSRETTSRPMDAKQMMNDMIG